MHLNIQKGYAPPPSKWEELKAEIKAAAAALGIDDIGFTTAEPFLYLKNILQEHRDNGYESGFEEPDLDKRTVPALQSGSSRSPSLPLRWPIPPKWRTRPNPSRVRAEVFWPAPPGARITIMCSVKRWRSWRDSSVSVSRMLCWRAWWIPGRL